MASAHEKDLVDSKSNDPKKDQKKKEESANSGCGSFRFNAAAPEFVPQLQFAAVQPQAQAQVPITGYFYPCFQYIDGTTGSWIYVADQETALPLVQPKPSAKSASAQTPQQQNQTKDNPTLSDEIKQKIIKQAEYMFSDMSLLANESFAKHVNKDPEGFVPINFVSTTKKLKSLSVNNQMVAQALRSSSKLVVSTDGKKVRRKLPFTEKEKEDLQMRTVIAENLPDDHSHQNIEKMFNVVGSIKAIRICQPHEPNSSRSSKSDLVVSNKLHALVEYENPETAEKAAEKLNDEGNWRKGMRVRVMLKRSPKSVLKSRKSDFDGSFLDDEEGSAHQSKEDSSKEAENDENAGTLKKSWSRNKLKLKHRPQLQSSRSLPNPSSQPSNSCPGEIPARQPAKGPRMPDGTRGFTMGRGKPLAIPVLSG